MSGGTLQFQDEAPGPVSVYTPTPQQADAALKYICSRLEPAAARVVLEALALITPIETGTE
jgi:hypothetical protein